MKVKVCGMRDEQNIAAIAELGVDMLGFIFYGPSPRNVSIIPSVDETVEKVGVFVNATLGEITKRHEEMNFTYVQLHGNETPDFCSLVKRLNVKVIKAFSVGESFDFSKLKAYGICDYFLFDTKGELPGGNGRVFNWKLLNEYDNEKPFFLSGGVGVESVADVSEIKGLNIYAIDVNSKFEKEPGLKNASEVAELLKLLRDV